MRNAADPDWLAAQAGPAPPYAGRSLQPDQREHHPDNETSVCPAWRRAGRHPYGRSGESNGTQTWKRVKMVH